MSKTQNVNKKQMTDDAHYKVVEEMVAQLVFFFNMGLEMR
jgi:hypothetical protein